MNEKWRCQWSQWSQVDWDSDCWETTCGNAFTLNDGTPRDNRMRFCCYCGLKLAQRKVRVPRHAI